MGPVPPTARAALVRDAAAYGVEVTRTRLSGYLDTVERAGCTQNLASLIGAETLRIHGVGYDDRPATDAELDTMRELVAEEMADGALGIGSSLIYAPGSYAGTEELVALCEVAATYGGTYASHVRDEGAGLLGAIDELLEIVRRSGVTGEMWHLKAAGQPQWPLMEHALAKLQTARDDGVPIGADVDPYTRSVPDSPRPSLRDGTREGPTRSTDRLADRDSVFTAFHSMSEDNLRQELTVPWVGVCSDAASIAPVGRSLDSPTHPRAYGSFARVLGHYTRDLGVLTLPDAVRRMTSLPASTFGLTDRGVLEPGYAADLVVLDPDVVADRATFADPRRS